MNILITSNSVAGRDGVSLITCELASKLIARGHQVTVYTRHLGPVASTIAGIGVETVLNLRHLHSRPDIIHGQHHPPTMAALRFFSDTPAIFVCHDETAWHDAAPVHPRIMRYVGIDYARRERLQKQPGVPLDRSDVIFNAVDLGKFCQRPPLPAIPKRALVFSNQASEDTYLPAVREACRLAGLHLDAVGDGVKAICSTPEHLLREYDLVFAIGRCAMEAMAVGCAVILCDDIGLGPMVSSSGFESLRQFNFGRRTLTRPHHPDLLLREIRRYDPEEAAAVSSMIRACANWDSTVEEWINLYESAITEFHSQPRDYLRELRAERTYELQWKWRLQLWNACRMFAVMRNCPIVGPWLHKTSRLAFNALWGDVSRQS